MSRVSRLIESLEDLVAREVIKGYVRMGDQRWLLTVKPGKWEEYLTTDEVEAFVKGARAAA